MELFEILFILFFILIPVLEGIRKGRQRRESPDIEEPRQNRPRAPGRPTTVERPQPGPPRTQREPEPVEAADMVPDDLWEILTGERRERPVPAEATEPEDAPWIEEPRWEPDEEVFADERFEPAPWEEYRDETRLELPGVPTVADEAVKAAAAAIESVQPPRPRRASLREVVETPRATRRASPLIRSLQRPEGLRQAVLLREILGPPKGLDP